MSQFAVYKNTNPATKAAVPFLLDIQSDLITEIGTRVVVPLYTAEAMQGKTLKTLTPTFEIEGKRYVMVTPQLAGISRKQLGAQVSDLCEQRDAIIAALDLLITGI
ncbi:plasmid maintenance protein CcdB [Stutzerimonas kirkiae]|uniref:Toxin CcdB n=1 Tax=Stutzerimonas kirkiae TaxID=2211392 RepID=A0A4V2KDC7_9GAMM|nr:CcdB family protein [Stutzerimonas kirkiae]TBU98594.1 plasmid maintenance protein CcdB [Stutzerimonas kirkiae]TBV04232.1 plasmid maintenance protein CcdB [Stutzerimonas kirkiae]